jgi:hypothetical protein
VLAHDPVQASPRKAGPDVFIAHAGEQKKEFVDTLRVLLRYGHGVNAFVDEWCLRPGDDAPYVMQNQLQTAAVGALWCCRMCE